MQPLKKGSQEQEAEGDPKPTWGAGALPKSSVPPPPVERIHVGHVMDGMEGEESPQQLPQSR